MLKMYLFVFFIVIFSILCYLLIVFKFSMWWMVFHSFFSTLLFMYLISLLVSHYNKYHVKNLVNLKKFFIYYVYCEVFGETIFLMGYLFDYPDFYDILIFLKMGMFPYMYYFYFLLGVSLEFVVISSVILLYLIFNKLWFMPMLSIFPVNEYNIWNFMCVSFIFLILDFKSSLSQFVVSSVIFSEVCLPIFTFCYCWSLILFYIFFISLVHYSMSNMLSEKESSYDDYKELYLTFFNGNTVFLFSWVKFLAVVNVVQFGLFKVFLITFTGTMYFFFSLYIFLICHSLTEVSKYYSIFMLMVLLVVNYLYPSLQLLFLNYSVLMWDFACPTTQSYSFFLILGNNLVLGLLMFYTIYPFFKYLFLLGLSTEKEAHYSLNTVSFEKGWWNFSSKVYFSNFSMSWDYFQYFSFLLPMFGVVFSLVNNFLMLAKSQEGFFGFDGAVIFTSFQWGWEVFVMFFIMNSEDIYHVLGGVICLSTNLSHYWDMHSKVLSEDNEVNYIMGGGNKVSSCVPVCNSFSTYTTSLDVIHAVGIPSMGLKMDSMPGHINSVYVEVFGESGDCYEVFCVEFCGVNHSYMGGEIIVVSNLEFYFFMDIKSSIFEFKDKVSSGCSKDSSDTLGLNMVKNKRVFNDYNKQFINKVWVKKISNKGPVSTKAYKIKEEHTLSDFYWYSKLQSEEESVLWVFEEEINSVSSNILIWSLENDGKEVN